ncbi:MAG: hypothetical protein FVQ84_00350 [Planctomycetes bacterium]|nr:hypothetical protein [Planctomycetota bacterium]
MLDALNKYIDPVVAVDEKYAIFFANEEAIRLWGSVSGKKCHEFIYKRGSKCPLCVKKDLEANGWSKTERRCRFIKDKNNNDIECYAIVTPYEMNPSDKCHLEMFTPVPGAIRGTRAIMGFAEELEKLRDPNEIFRALVEFLSSDKTDLKCRTRCYSLEQSNHNEGLRLIFHDHRMDTHPYLDDIGHRVMNRQPTSQFNASFACLDQKVWFLLTPEPQKVDAFKIHFRAKNRDNQENLWDADPFIARQLITLYLYDRIQDGIATIFKDPRPHTFLDIPIYTKKKAYGKLSITLWENSFLFYREHIEELCLIEKFVTRRLAAIESLDETRSAVSQNVIHEVAQPAFAGLSSMEALRRRDRDNGRTARDEQVDYYLKKNVECSLKMVAFLNDRGRITEDIPSFSDTTTNFLSDVVAPVVNLTRFGIYEKYLRDSGEKMNPSELEDIQEPRFKSSESVKSVFGGIIYEISYGGRCDEVEVYIEKYRLQQVVYNLLHNALKYKGHGYHYMVRIQYRPTLTVKETELFADYYVIDVTDQGYGVERGEQEKIFRLFKQGINARKVSNLPGTGRGLYVCRAILRGVGGEVFVQNMRSPTVFRVLIPRECRFDDWLSKLEDFKGRTREIMRLLREGDQL